MNNRRTDDTDHGLIAKFKKGSMDAMEKIVERYEQALFSFGMKMCGQREDAEDVAQDTFLNAFKSLHRFREEAKLKNWLFRIAANACIRKRRKKKHEPDRELSLDALYSSDDSNNGYEIPDWTNDPDKALQRAELKSTIDKAILELPHKYRLVLTLRDIEGFSTEETSDILDITTQSVKTRLHRARVFMRKAISESFKEERCDGS